VFAIKSVDDLVDQEGAYHTPAVLPILALVLGGCFVLLALGLARSPREGEPPLLLARHRALLLAVLLIGLMAVSALYVVQVSRNGVVSYYFVKLLLGYELMLAVIVPALVAIYVVAKFGHRRTLPRAVASVALTLAATVAFGVVTPAEAGLISDDDPGTAGISPPYSRRDLAAGILAAAKATDDRASFGVVYVALGPGNSYVLRYPDGWLHALHSSVSSRVMVREETMAVTVSTAAEAVPVVTALLEAEPHLVFLLPEASAAELRDALPASLDAHIASVPAPDE
jgi:hypothetical protein